MDPLALLGVGKIQAVVFGGLLLACGSLYLLYDSAAAKRDLAVTERNVARSERDSALAVNAENLESLKQLRAYQVQANDALAWERDQHAKVEVRTRTIIREVSRAPSTNVCLGTPAADAFFRGLRAGAADGANQDPGRAADRAGTAPGVRDGTGAPRVR